MRRPRRGLARLLLLCACAIVFGAGACQPQLPSVSPGPRRPTTAPATATARTPPRVTAWVPTPAGLSTPGPMAYGTPAPTNTPPRVCAPADRFAHTSDYLGSFRFEPIATAGRTGIISDTRVVIRSAPVPGSTAMQFAFWFQGRGGDAAPYVNQLRLIATAECLDTATGAGIANIVPALRPDDFVVPPLSFGASAGTALDGSDPYGFRLYVRAPDGGLPPETLPAEYGFVTGGTIMLTEYGPGIEAWHASGTISLTLAVRSGQAVPAIEGRFDLLAP